MYPTAPASQPPYIPVAKNENEQLLNAQKVFTQYWKESQWVWPENKADQSNVNVWCHMTCVKVIFEACHDTNIHYLLFYTLHRDEVGVDGAEKEICSIVIDVLLLVLDIVWGTAIIFNFPLSCKGGRIVMVCNSQTKAQFISEQSLTFPLSVACSVWKLGWLNTFSAPSLYRYPLTHWWRCCAAQRRFQEDCLVYNSL